jgi:hypothetical protein
VIIAGNSDLDIEYVNVHLNGNQELNLRDLSYTAKDCRHRGQRSELNLSDRPEPTLQDMPYVASSRHLWQGAVFDPAKRHELNDRSLIYLLETFNRQKRQIGQGRLCPTALFFQVGYNVTSEELAFWVLLNCTRSLCLCSVRTVADALRMDPYSYLTKERWSFPFTKISLPLTIVSHTNSQPHRIMSQLQ